MKLEYAMVQKRMIMKKQFNITRNALKFSHIITAQSITLG